eukprot:365937-Rhodomonas_salina.1
MRAPACACEKHADGCAAEAMGVRPVTRERWQCRQRRLRAPHPLVRACLVCLVCLVCLECLRVRACASRRASKAAAHTAQSETAAAHAHTR